MTGFSRSLLRRLQHLPQLPSTWEGDRRPLRTQATATGTVAEPMECILWVDTREQIVLAFELVPPDAPPEAMVRTLVRAMQQPNRPGKPGVPRRVLVRDRQLQFFLRGALQGLDTTIEYAPLLPSADDAFNSLQQFLEPSPLQLPPRLAQSLQERALALWQVAPWRLLADHQIVALQIDRWGVSTLYASVLGLLGSEYGVLFYRSEESLRRFRARLNVEHSSSGLEEAYLQQDCLFVNYHLPERTRGGGARVEPLFGSLHPLEGLRPTLDEEECLTLMVALEALERFVGEHGRRLAPTRFPAVEARYMLSPGAPAEAVPVRLATLPTLAADLLAPDPAAAGGIALRDDLVPDGAYVSLGAVPWLLVEHLRAQDRCFGTSGPAVEELPAVVIQTSGPKTKVLIERLQGAGGVNGIGLNPAESPYVGERYDLVIARLGNGNLFLLNDFLRDDPQQARARRLWKQRSKKAGGLCALVLARGVTGASRGRPEMKDFVGVFLTAVLESGDLGLGTLQLLPNPSP